MDKPRKSLADFMAIAISPVLIMALVGSLVFFLLEILYVGQYQGSLQWILFFFVFGAVLIARIAMTAAIADRAAGYGLVLGFLVWLALLRFVEYPRGTPMAGWGWGVNLGLIVIIWWSAHRLTWDCTLIDDQADASGAGLLQVAGLEKKPSETAPPVGNEPAAEADKKKKPRALKGLAGWRQRYASYREQQRKKPHTPGVWVVYFSLAALPLFGLGQAQIPPTDQARRAYAFQLLAIYVASGLGLLLTTSFLGLRRYLRQRQLRMPAAVTSAWLTLGALLIALVLGLGILLPRPEASVKLWDWTGAGSRELDTSPLAQVGEGREKKKDETATRTQKSKDGPEKAGKAPDSGKGSNGKDKSNPKNSAAGKDKDGKGSGDKKDEKGSGPSVKADKRESSGGKQASKENGREKEAGGQPAQPDSSAANPLTGLLNNLAPLLKWIVMAILILLVVFFLLRAGLRFLANFTSWAQRLLAAFQAWWSGLGKLWQRRDSAAEEAVPVQERPPRPFSSYADPFLTGRAQRMSAGELVRYTFEALEAWAREHDLGRRPGETPLEFTQRIAAEMPVLAEGTRRLGGYYIRLAYANGSLAGNYRDPLRDFWLTLAQPVAVSKME